MATDAAIRSYKDLRVWREAMDLAKACYRMSACFPRDEACGLAEEVMRSAVSVPASIAQGFDSGHKDFHVQLLQAARGSLKRLETHLILAERVAVTSAKATTPILAHCQDIGQILDQLIRSLQRHGTTDTQ